MGRFVVFDQETRDNLQEPSSSEVELNSSRDLQHELDYLLRALDSGRTALLLLPSATGGQVRLIRTRYPVKLDREQPVREPEYEATGFLGLTDVHLYDDEKPAPRKWWQRLWS